VFQVGKVPQPITRPMPRPTIWKCFFMTSGGFLPWGFSHGFGRHEALSRQA
jgi:hypothetical protein